MQKRSTRWMNLLMRAFNSALLVLFSAAVGAAEEEPAPIEYEITSPKGEYYGTIDGKTAYQDWRRGTFDREVMNEIKPADKPDNAPEPVVIPFVAPAVQEVPAGKPKKPLKGEDKIFVQIGKDEKKARCFILGEGCEELVEPEVKDSIYFRPIQAQQERMAAEAAEKEQQKRREIIKAQ